MNLSARSFHSTGGNITSSQLRHLKKQRWRSRHVDAIWVLNSNIYLRDGILWFRKRRGTQWYSEGKISVHFKGMALEGTFLTVPEGLRLYVTDKSEISPTGSLKYPLRICRNPFRKEISDSILGGRGISPFRSLPNTKFKVAGELVEGEGPPRSNF